MTVRLTMEIVPTSCWYSNLRDHLTRAQWDLVRKDVYRKANFRCEICGGAGDRWPVECHEIWQYDDEARVQSLRGLVALCPSCHQVKHFVLATSQGFEMKALRHLCRVNGWDLLQGRVYADEQLALYQLRSSFDWELDMTWIEQAYGIRVDVHRKKMYR